MKTEPAFTDDFGDIATLSNKKIEPTFKLNELKSSSINPSHYKSHPSGIECIQITEHMSFNLGNCLKYIWRADLKHDDGGIEDLNKALWYIKRELTRRQKSDT
jgi:hypothetical protein